MAAETIDFAGTRDAALIMGLAPSDRNAERASKCSLARAGRAHVLMTDSPSSYVAEDAAAWFEAKVDPVSGPQTLAALMCLALTLTAA